MDSLNKMNLNVNPAGEGGEDCEIYGGEYPEVNIDQINQ